jgi:hypothetical protein
MRRNAVVLYQWHDDGGYHLEYLFTDACGQLKLAHHCDDDEHYVKKSAALVYTRRPGEREMKVAVAELLYAEEHSDQWVSFGGLSVVESVISDDPLRKTGELRVSVLLESEIRAPTEEELEEFLLAWLPDPPPRRHIKVLGVRRCTWQ